MRTRFKGPSSDRLYVARVCGGGTTNGGPNSAQLDSFHGDLVPVAFNTNTSTDAVNRSYARRRTRRSNPLADSRAQASATWYCQRRTADARQRKVLRARAPAARSVAGRRLLGRDHTADLALGVRDAHKQALRVAGGVDQSFTKAWSRVHGALRPAASPAIAGRLRRCASVLPVGQRRQGEPGQDLPRRDRSRPGVPVGTGGRGRHDRHGSPPPRSHREASPCPARDVRNAPRRHAVQDDKPMARCRATRGRTARWRRIRRRRVDVPDGLAIGPCGDRGLYRRHAIRRPTSSSPTARSTESSAGRSRTATRRRRSPPR